MTFRENLIAAALQGLLSNPPIIAAYSQAAKETGQSLTSVVAINAIAQADEVISLLEKRSEKTEEQ